MTQLGLLALIIGLTLFFCGSSDYFYVAIILVVAGLVALVIALAKGDLKLFGD